MSNNWKVVTGDDGQEYYEVNAQIVVPDTMSNADGVVMMAVQPGVVGTFAAGPVVASAGGQIYAMDSNQGGYNIEQLFAMRNAMWNSRPGIGPVTVSRWLPGDPEREPQHPAGRFQNLDWDEAS